MGPLPSHVHPCHCISTASVPFPLKILLGQLGAHLPSESSASACLITHENGPIKLLAEGRLCQRHSARLSRKPSLLTRSRKHRVSEYLHLQYLEGTLSLISLIFHRTLSFTGSCSLLLTQQPKHTNKTIGKMCQKVFIIWTNFGGFSGQPDEKRQKNTKVSSK